MKLQQFLGGMGEKTGPYGEFLSIFTTSELENSFSWMISTGLI